MGKIQEKENINFKENIEAQRLNREETMTKKATKVIQEEKKIGKGYTQWIK